MAKTKHVWELSKRKIPKLRKEIVLNSMFLHDYENSFGLDPKEVMAYFDGYMEFLYDNTEFPEGMSDLDKLNKAFKESDTKENLLIYHETYDRL